MKVGDTLSTGEPTPCVFCRGKLYLAQKPTGLIHTLPPCELFIRLEPDQFLAASIARSTVLLTGGAPS